MLEVLDPDATRARLPAAVLLGALAQAMRARRAGTLHAPERSVLPLAEGASYLAMPAADATLAICKLITVHPANPSRGLPTIRGQVLVTDAASGASLALLDGPTVTARRTAGVSLLALRRFAAPRAVAIIGTGAQAIEHARMLAETGLASELHLAARRPDAGPALAESLRAEGLTINCHGHAGVLDALAALGEGDAVICLTTATEPVLPDDLPDGVLAIGAGAFKPHMAELPAALLARRDIVVDDLTGARHEAGDLLRAGIDWSRVDELADWIDAPGRRPSRPGVAVKTVGQAAWDLAAAHVACAS
ncbi:delta(1)-pyrroline-2-carboxylate reductase family protein [Caldimonas sp. KR1-144]|uniref:delta(1)-pyrroline-2-carboxylate reductase family protein n=1 Tax=Caldimonas sp. KR1-144 TaxID=3400911 RepID=UPI003C0EBA23